MAVIAVLECHFKPEQVDAAIDWLRRNLVATRAFDGCLGVEVFKDHDDPSRLVVVEHWASVEHDRAYRAWRDGEVRYRRGRRVVRAPPRADGWRRTRRRVGPGGDVVDLLWFYFGHNSYFTLRDDNGWPTNEPSTGSQTKP